MYNKLREMNKKLDCCIEKGSKDEMKRIIREIDNAVIKIVRGE